MTEIAATGEEFLKASEGGGDAADLPASSDDHWRPNVLLAGMGLLLVAACVILFFSEIWLFETWESLSVDEILYHLRTSLEGTNSTMVRDYLVRYASKELAVVALATSLLILARKRKALYRALLAAMLAAALGALAWAVTDLDRQIGLFSYLEQAQSGEEADFIEQHYIDPADVDIAFPEQKRNVIYLMLESMEITYADQASGGAFDRNVIPELTELAREHEDFSGMPEGASPSNDEANGALCLPGCTWTMGAMFALTSGLPLKLPLSGNQLETAESFYPGITAMGDILANEGYAQELLIGSDAAFGGRELYFTQHGGYFMNDYIHAQEAGLIPEGYHVFWGYEDEKLFDFAKQRLTELAAGDEPFNLTMLTVDTHFEDGYVCQQCESQFAENKYANVMACSSKRVSEFVEWVKRQPFYENTAIVICGDHTTMDSDFCEEVPDDYDRRVVTAIINGSAENELPDVRRAYSTLDMFPTTLAAMGATIPGGRLGLGANLFSEAPTLVEMYGLDTCEAQLSKHSDFMDAFSEIIIDEEDMALVAQNARLSAKIALGPKPESPNSTQPGFDTEQDQVRESDVDAVLHEAPEGSVVFVLQNCYTLNSEALLDARLLITDVRTGATSEFSMDLVQNRPNYFWHTCITDFREEDLPYLTAIASLSVEGYGKRNIASWGSDHYVNLIPASS